MAFSVESETFQIYLTSDGCLDKFPRNKPSDFRIALKTPKEFRNPNNKYSVGLARFGYDSALYNLGPNTGTFIRLFLKGKYYQIETISAFATDAISAATILNEAVDSLSHKLGFSNELHFENHVFFYADNAEKISMKLAGIDDFAMSPMLRKLLGFHDNTKLLSDDFEIRKLWRDFLIEISRSQSISNDLQAIEANSPKIEKTVQFEKRNFFRAPYNLNIEQFFHQLSYDLETILLNFVKDKKMEFQEFQDTKYYFSESKSNDYVFFSEKEKRLITIPFSVWSIVDFMIFYLSAKSVKIEKASPFTFKPNTSFSPHLFNCLYVYSNLVKPVDFNDKQFRLLDIVFLKHSAGVQSGVVEHQSTHFKSIEIDTINEIQIFITTSLGFPAPFIHGPVFVVLEFRQ